MSEEQTQQAEMPNEEPQGAAPEMTTESAIRFALGLFIDLAWMQLGIRANPGSGEAKTDLSQAKLSIDSIAALIPLTEGRFDPHEIRDLRNMLSSLQLNFVQRKTTETA